MTNVRLPMSLERQRAVPTTALNALLSHGILPIAIGAMYCALGLIQPQFLTGENALNILRQASYLTILTLGQMFALLTGGFDLSVGTLISVASVFSALVMVRIAGNGPTSEALSVLAGCSGGLGLGALLGAINGICIAFFRINPFVVTLGMQGVCFGLATTLSGGAPVFNLPRVFTSYLNQLPWLFVPTPVIACVGLVAVAYLILSRTVFGRAVYIIGSNARAAHVAGLSSRLHLAGAYVICSTFASVDALLLTARTGSGEPHLGGGLMISSIAAAVIGGISLRGGEGSVIQAIYGALFVTMLTIGMNLVRVNGYVQQVILGVVVIGAVLLDRLRTRMQPR